MNKQTYEKIVKKIKLEKNVNIDLDFKTYCEYLEGLNGEMYYSKNIKNYNKNLFELCEIITVFWALFSVSCTPTRRTKSRELKTIFFSLTTQISNNMLSILELSSKGLDYQVGIIMRSTIELTFTLIVILIDSGKAKKYFDSFIPENEYKIWKQEFSFNELNKRIIEYEKNTLDEEGFNEMEMWRRNNYKFYSQYIHNGLFRCFACAFTRSKNSKEILRYNILGGEATRMVDDMRKICELMFYITLTMQHIFKENQFYKNDIGDKLGKESWNHANYLILIFLERFSQLYLK